MNISKRDSRCNPHPTLGMEIPSNFTEQFSDSSSNQGDLPRTQNNNKAASSPCGEEITQNFSKTDSCPKEGDIDSLANSNGTSSALSSPTSKKTLPQQTTTLNKSKTTLCPSASSLLRDEKEIKKEDGSLSPHNISPMGFTSAVVGLRDNDDSNGVNRTINRSPSSSDKSNSFPRSGCNEIEKRSNNNNINVANSGIVTSNIEMLGTSVSPKCKTESDLGSNISNISRNLAFNGNLAKFNSSSSGGESGVPLNSSGNSSGGDYMQQQNHVFVFSTQLANKSAEAVLCGQFPTIIAYHCMQPTTKLFLEDFLKNPAKTTKLQRQYSLNIMNAMQSGSTGTGGGEAPYWLNECNNLGRLPSQRLPMRNVGANVVGKNNPSWDPASVLEKQICPTPNASTLDNLNNAEVGVKSDDKTTIPSLQGVKVPDENLTPQQRQHREEQLAKLKKMNKFLFPENEGNDFQGPPPHNNSSSTSDNAADMMHNHAGLGPDVMANKICPPAMRNIPGNMPKSGPQSLDTLPGMGVSDSILPPDILGSSNDAPNVGRTQNLKLGGYMSKNSSSFGNFNAVKPRQSDMGSDQIVAGMESGSENAPLGNFNVNNCPPSEIESLSSGQPEMTMNQSAEWTKFQSSTFQDSFKGERLQNVNEAGLPAGSIGCQQNPALSRSLSTGITGYGNMQSKPNTGPGSTNRNNNGPPPPYHRTPRSASVPIAADLPTHASPNKQSAEMSLPSPQAASRVQFGVSPTPPNPEISNPTISTCTTYVGSTSVNSTAQVNSQNNTLLQNMATNSPASLPHISPRELDCIEQVGQKAKLASPHKFKSGPGLMNDLPDMDTKYNNFGMGYPTCNMPPQNMRHNMQQMPPQFCRRIDNIPLNPNCGRMGQGKNAPSFDPISSLTQMSQQLTGVGLSAMGGGSNATGGLGVMDINQAELMTGGSSIRASGDPSLDHCNQLSNANNMGIIGGLTGALGRVTGQFGADMNNMMCGDTGLMDQRMLNGKMCVPNMPGSFGSNAALTGVGLRESAMGCNDIGSSNRMISRRGMSGNFDNFSMSPNIHVKVSAPNTIQYMPARSQNMNNMRLPPSIEFFQRYSNSQGMGNMGGAGVGHTSGLPMTNDITNNPNAMNMFGNCTQMPTGMGQLIGNGGRGFEQNDLVEGNVLSNNEYMNVPQ